LIGLLSKSKNNKSFQALLDVSFSIKKGEVFGIIGTNGSGKTTLLRIICGIYKPDKGHVEVKGRLSQLMEIGAGFQKELAAKENIIINGMLLGLSKSQIERKVESIIEYADLKKFTNLILKHYSSGMKARLAFATAMQINPDILIVDEIMSVGDKNFRKKSYETFLSFQKKNKTIIMATHSLGSLSQICDRVLLLNKGKNIMVGKPEDVLKKYQEIKS
jgi:ABC-type polysaccharide/polyol phosphate transport system ATPase subunit